MSAVAVGIMLIGIIMPDPSAVHMIHSGDSAPRVYQDGEAWISIFESDYTFLQVSCDSQCRLRAFDDSGNLCAIAGEGEDLVLSAFSDYYFYIVADNPGFETDSVTFHVSDVLPDTATAEETIEAFIHPGTMGLIYSFVPSVTGEWTFSLEGPEDVDFDLEIYGDSFYSPWDTSIGVNSTESVTVPGLAGETLYIVVKKVYPKEEGWIDLRIEHTGSFPAFPEDDTVLSGKIGPDDIKRILLPGDRESHYYLEVNSDNIEDLDIYISDQGGETLMSSIDYGSRETLIIPPGRSELLIEIFPGYLDRNAVYEMTLIPLEDIYSDTLCAREPLELSSESNLIVGFSPDSTGFYSIEADFTGFKRCNFEVFRNSGEEILDFNVARREDEFLLYIAQSDTIWLNPYLPDHTRDISNTAYISISEFTDSPLSSEVHTDSITTEVPVHMFIVDADSNAVLDVTLYGESNDVDLDLFVSGPDADFCANASWSSVDAAGHESVAVYSPDETQYAVTVYLWDKEGRTPYTLIANNIEAVPLAESSPEEEIWVLVAGLSDYPGSVDDLQRGSMDAIEFYRFITEEQGIPYSHTVLLVDATATLDAFKDALLEILSTAGPEDRVVVSYSGHGSQEGFGTAGFEEYDLTNEVLCLYDGDLSDDWLSDAVLNGPGCPVIIYLDACHSGGFVNDFTEGSNTQVITAAREDLSVYERIFMPILLRGISGDADFDLNGYVSTSEIFVYVDEQLKFKCPECGDDLEDNGVICPECGAIFKEDNPVPRAQQGDYLEEELDLWQLNNEEGKSE